MSDYVKRFCPPVMKLNDTMNSIYEAENVEIRTINNNVLTILKNTSIVSSNIDGIKKWEKILKIKSDSSKTLDERKEICLEKLLIRPPITRIRLDQILKNTWGEGNYLLKIIPNEFLVLIVIDTVSNYTLKKFESYIREIIPANLGIITSIPYIHIYLKQKFVYNELRNYTYGELSQYS